MARSVSKGPFIHPSLLKRVRAVTALSRAEGNVISKYPIYTKARSSVIFDAMNNMIVFVHNGKTYIKLNIRSDMIGYRLGVFIPTRFFKGHKKKTVTNVSKKKKFGK